MNWSIEQNYILLQFIRCYGENEWFKHVNELRDLFSVYLTVVLDVDISSFTEDDFRRQYNYILATTRQECQKQGLKIIKSSELTEIASKKFFNYLEQQQHSREDYGQLQLDIRLLEEGRVWEIEKDKLRDMREKIFNVVGEDLIGIAFGLGKMDRNIGKEEREKCLKDMSESWLRRLSDGRICVAGDTDIFRDEFLNQLYETSGMSMNHTNTDSDSDATETLEEVSNEDGVQIIPFETALEQAGMKPSKYLKAEHNGFVKEFSNQKIIAGWKLTGTEHSPDLDAKLLAWEDEYSKLNTNVTEFMHNKLSSRMFEMITDRQRRNSVQYQYSSRSSASTQEALTTRLTVSVATESCDMTPGSQSVDTAISHVTFDDLDEVPVLAAKEAPCHSRRRKRTRQTGLTVKRTHEKGNYGPNRDAESKKKIMRNITKMIVDHPYSSIFTKPLHPDTTIYKQPILNIAKISHDVMNGDFVYYEQFIETVILFFLQMKIYHFNNRETVKKIESVYADISKQLSIIYPDLNESAPLSDLIQRRQSRFQGHYA